MKEKHMAAYMIFLRESTIDQSELEVYWEKIKGALEGRSLKPLAAYGRHLAVEGPDVEGVVVAEFPTFEEASDFYYSPAYQEAAQHRHRGAVYRGLIVEGL